MPVHPALQPLLDGAAQAAQAAPPPTEPEARLAMLRIAVETFSVLGGGEPEVMHAVDDLFADGPHGAIAIRRYLPTDEPGLPAVVFFHGGGFVCGNVACYDGLVRRIAKESGAAVFSVEYRLAPEHPFPIPLDDCHTAVQWVVANADDLGVDGTRVAVAGDSAGGNLSAAIALRARVDGPPLRAQVLVYPVIDPACDTTSMDDNASGYLLTADAMREMWSFYMRGGANPEDTFLAVDKAADLSGLPPALVITAEYDPLRDEGEHYAQLLDGFDVETKMIRYDGMIHGFLGMREIVPESNQAVGEIATFLSARLA